MHAMHRGPERLRQRLRAFEATLFAHGENEDHFVVELRRIDVLERHEERRHAGAIVDRARGEATVAESRRTFEARHRRPDLHTGGIELRTGASKTRGERAWISLRRAVAWNEDAAHGAVAQRTASELAVARWNLVVETVNERRLAFPHIREERSARSQLD